MVAYIQPLYQEDHRPGWSIFGYHYPLRLVNFGLSQPCNRLGWGDCIKFTSNIGGIWLYKRMPNGKMDTWCNCFNHLWRGKWCSKTNAF